MSRYDFLWGLAKQQREKKVRLFFNYEQEFEIVRTLVPLSGRI